MKRSENENEDGRARGEWDKSHPRVEELPVAVPNLGRILLELGNELRSIYPQVVTASVVATVDDGRMVMLPVP